MSHAGTDKSTASLHCEHAEKTMKKFIKQMFQTFLCNLSLEVNMR